MIAIIPARGGSKGLPGKNVKNLNGKPLIAYTIEAAKKSREISEVFVSTDDAEIANVAIEYGASVPFIRPSYLSNDTSSAIDVYIHAIEHLMTRSKQEIGKFIVLLPTNPLRNENHISEAINLFKKETADTLISVYEAETPPAWYFKLNNANRLINAGFDNSKELVNRQENGIYYIPNGGIYILDFNLLKFKRTYYSENTVPYVMSKRFSVDIDSLDDFNYAEFLLKNS